VISRADIEERVRGIIAEALDVPREDVTPQASLIDDLGAESIDFLDILFRIESAFDIKIPEQEMWQGTIDASSEAKIATGVAELARRLPEFDWSRLPARLTRDDLPRLITPHTIIQYLSTRLGAEGTSAA
jgi:acyl carrier protein